MGVFSRIIHINEIKKEINMVLEFSIDDRIILNRLIIETMADIYIASKLDISGVLESKHFNIVENSEWSSYPYILSRYFRVPLEKLAKSGNGEAITRLLVIRIIISSIRAVLDFELYGNRKLLLYSQKLWAEISCGKRDNIPDRFR